MALVSTSRDVVEPYVDLGAAPLQVAQPRDVDECAALLGDAASARSAVIPWGGGTQQALGSPPARCDLILSLASLAGVEFYRPEDLTIGVRAGTTVADVAAHLAAHGQFLPLDAARAGSATIGGIVATGFAPVRRFRYGSVRDLVIGVDVLLADGARCHGGGRVVKNVAGYDLCKLFTGSLGTLGVIVGVNFKVQPLPPVQAILTAEYEQQDHAFGVASAIARASLCCSAIVLEWTLPAPRWRITMVAEGFRGAVGRQLEEARRLLGSQAAGLTVAEGAGPVSGAVAALATCRAAPPAGGALLLRCTGTPSVLAAAVRDLVPVLGRTFTVEYVQADVPLGTWHIGMRAASWDDDHLERYVAELTRARALLRGRGAHLLVAAAPVALRRRCDPWDAPAAGAALSRSLKRQLDPAGVLNPGRFAYGI